MVVATTTTTTTGRTGRWALRGAGWRRRRVLPSRAPVGTRALRFDEYVQGLQSDMIEECEGADGSGRRFRVDAWERERGEGFGRTCVLEDGSLFEKAAINVSVIRDVLTEERARAMSERGRASIESAGGQAYEAEALSLVFHPRSPLVPTLRADVRRFKVGGSTWYGGGCDITPVYLNEDDCKAFHGHWKELCSRHSEDVYPEFKRWCDRYFYIPARGEHRGVGGIFFDDLEDGACEAYDVEAFVQEFGRGILASWLPFARERNALEFTEDQKEWQEIRRGRYVEFNLLYDRGIKFGLNGGRMESIMVSAPPSVRWRYDVVPKEGSEEARLLEVLRGKPRDW
ncbi:coproporphyrinogen III oxidase [Chloropicon primus]|uniref:Coproporphyrinogen III oxidase n=3 Tax=Chloropicon primus TaxID=1764295 RepID=A0A5B8MDL9_9CHLO|nr:coproporphyrinogen III oxidase [Chloropicon primus]UPQ96942.1 coproporphyrinogen III oxidase [Chloropicon primus]|eukprot:QDZ17725.1 coproporphyrinogen III oxidase [Chloropicon primus]